MYYVYLSVWTNTKIKQNSLEALEDWVKKQFPKLVKFLSAQRRETEIKSQGLLLLSGECGKRSIRKVEERAFVKLAGLS